MVNLGGFDEIIDNHVKIKSNSQFELRRLAIVNLSGEIWRL